LTTADAQLPTASDPHFLLTDPGAHTDSYSIGNKVLSRGDKAAGA